MMTSTTEKSDSSHVPIPIYIRNFPFPNLRGFNTKKIEDSLDYISRDGDIILCSYPKTGTTWMTYIIWSILRKGEDFPNLQEMTFKFCPFMEMSGIEPIEALPPPRIYKHHFPYNLMKINKNAKYIYVYRNPMDTVISFYHFVMDRFNTTFKFDDFFEDFITGTVIYGDYFDHVLSFDLHKDDPHLLMISYEDLHRDKKNQVLRVAEFLGQEYYQALTEDEILLQKILDDTSFNNMKQNIDTSFSLTENGETRKEDIPMFRKGIIGDGKTVLTPDQKERLQQIMLAKMEGTDYVQHWSQY